MTWSLTERVRKILDVSKTEASEIVKSAEHESSVDGSGKSANDKGILKNPVKTTRRALISALLASPVVIGGVFRWREMSYALDKAADFAVSYLSNRAASDGPALTPINNKIHFSERFVDFVNKNRQESSISSKLWKNALPEEVEFVEYLKWFRGGGQLNSDQAVRLRDLCNNTVDESTKLMLVDLLTSQYLRCGAGSISREYFAKIDPTKLANAAEHLVFVEKELAHAFTLLSPQYALYPDKWGFERGLEQAASLGLDQIGMQIKGTDRGYSISIRDRIRLKNANPFSGVKAFYAISLLLHYKAASEHGSNLKEMANIQLLFLKERAKIPGLRRAVWNTSFVCGLFYHRRGISTQNAFKEFSIRDCFFDICFNQAGKGWPEFDDRVSDQGLSANDPAAIALVLTILSDNETHLRERYRGFASPAVLLNFRNAVDPICTRRAIDQIRINAGLPAEESEKIEIYTTDDRSLSLYLPPSEQIRRIVKP